MSCVEPYDPGEINQNFSPLVVDGYIDLDGSALVKLSRATQLSASDSLPTVTGAAVTIESSGGETFQLHEDESGTYTAANLAVNKLSTYALHVVTEDNDYRSDNVRIYSTPPIDSVYWTINGINQLEIMLDSHDDNPDGPGLYLASGIETYEYHADLVSNYKFVNKHAVPRTPDEYIDVCWRDVVHPSVIVNTNTLKKTVMSGLVLSTIDPTNSQKLIVRYSILARLRAVSQEEYDFQRRLIANEQTGTLFSAIPGTILSNVQSTKDPEENVLGYFRGQQMREFRYFIDENTRPIPAEFRQPAPNTCKAQETCRFDATSVSLCLRRAELKDDTIITDIVMFLDYVAAYIYTTPECGDCRLQGGTTTRPPYW